MDITDQQFEEAMDGVMEYQKQETDKLLAALKFVLGEIDYPPERIKEYLRDGDNYHIGYCRVYEEENYKSPNYPDHKFYSVVDEDNKEYYIPHFLMRQDDNSEDSFHCLVWQTTVCGEDDYEGYILFPLTDGRYWVVRFEC